MSSPYPDGNESGDNHIGDQTNGEQTPIPARQIGAECAVCGVGHCKSGTLPKAADGRCHD